MPSKSFSEKSYSITLNHIGIAVRDPAPLKKIFSIMGLVSESDAIPQERVETQGVVTHFIPVSSLKSAPGGQLELLEPFGEVGAVQKFIEKRGEGVHHLSFLVPTGHLDSLQKKLTDAKYKMVYSEPQPGAHQMRVNFIHPSQTSGVLIEIMEKQEKFGKSNLQRSEE